MKNECIQIQKTKKMGRGIFAKKDIPTGTSILVIQENNFLTYTAVKQHPIFGRIQEDIQSKLSCFAFYLSYCENLSDPSTQELSIQSYIKDLPNFFHNLICWDDEQLQMLNNPDLIQKIKNSKELYYEKYMRIKMSLGSLIQKQQTKKNVGPEIHQQSRRSTRQRSIRHIRQDTFITKNQISTLQQITFTQMLKYIAAIKSRNIYWANHECDCNSEVGALIPYLQLFNHSQNTQCDVKQKHESYEVTAIRPIKKGEEIFVKYGDSISIEQFLQDYGMIPFDQTNRISLQKENKQNQKSISPNEENTNSKEQIHSERIQLSARYTMMGGDMNKEPIAFRKNPLAEKN